MKWVIGIGGYGWVCVYVVGCVELYVFFFFGLWTACEMWYDLVGWEMGIGVGCVCLCVFVCVCMCLSWPDSLSVCLSVCMSVFERSLIHI